MKVKVKNQVEEIIRLTKQLAEAFAEAAIAEAKSVKNGYDYVIQKLRQQMIFDPCTQSLGYCTPSGSTRQQMSECDCVGGTSSCAWSPHAAHGPPWESAATVFGKLGQILAETYAVGSTDLAVIKKANEEVIGKLVALIKEANENHPAPDVGICTVQFTKSPTKIPMTRAQCSTIDGTWQPKRSS